MTRGEYEQMLEHGFVDEAQPYVDALEQDLDDALTALKAAHIIKDERAEHIEELELYKSEHERLKIELNEILHPLGGAPKNPSFCDLVAYARSDMKAHHPSPFKNIVFDRKFETVNVGGICLGTGRSVSFENPDRNFPVRIIAIGLEK